MQEVTCAASSKDATLLCTGDTSGRVCVRGVWSLQVECEFVTFAHTKWLAWHPKDKLLVAGTVDGILWRWKIRGCKCKTMQGSFTTCDDGDVLAGGRRVAVVYDDDSVCVGDLKRARLLHGMRGLRRMHAGAVTSVDVRGELVATGADTMQVSNSDTGEVVAIFLRIELAPPAGLDDDNNVGTLSLESQQETLAAGTDSGVLAIVDLPSVLEKRSYVHPDVMARAVWGGPHTVFTGCADGFVRVFDVPTESHDAIARWK
ncbi:angio-associated migratory cell protein-like [Haemaphysalis longicornis]